MHEPMKQGLPTNSKQQYEKICVWTHWGTILPENASQLTSKADSHTYQVLNVIRCISGYSIIIIIVTKVTLSDTGSFQFKQGQFFYGLHFQSSFNWKIPITKFFSLVPSSMQGKHIQTHTLFIDQPHSVTSSQNYLQTYWISYDCDSMYCRATHPGTSKHIHGTVFLVQSPPRYLQI